MSQTPQKQRRSLEKWRAIISAYQQSSMSKAAFCKEHKLSRSNFYMWDQYFRNAAKAQELSPPSAFFPVIVFFISVNRASLGRLPSFHRLRSSLLLLTKSKNTIALLKLRQQ